MTKATLVRRIPRKTQIMASDPFFREFDRFFSEDRFMPSSAFGRWLGGEQAQNRWLPAVDVHETEEAYVFSAELPGLEKDDVDITLEENTLTVSGERTFEEKEEVGTYHRVERAYGSFNRSFTLPGQVDNEAVSASFKNGLLTISVPKSEQAKARKITIK